MANSLTVALAALGGVVLAGVVAHGAWQARRAGPRRAAVEPAPHREPVLDSPGAPGGAATAAAHPAELAPASEPRPVRRASPRLDALIEPQPVLVEADDEVAHARGQLVGAVLQNGEERSAQGIGAGPNGDPMLGIFFGFELTVTCATLGVTFLTTGATG